MKIIVNSVDESEKLIIKQLLKKEKDLIHKINKFFNINNLIDLKIDILSYSEYKKEFIEYLELNPNDNMIGFVEDDKNKIIILNYSELKYTNHRNDSRKDYIKTIIHEYVHVVHGIACRRNYPEESLLEGIAVYLSNQYNEDTKNYTDNMFIRYARDIYNLINTKGIKEVLNMLNVNI